MLAIINYNAGNIQSVKFAMERIGATYILTSDPEILQKADKVIFPGVGEAGSTMKYLRAHKLDELIKGLKQPVLGICLGMQLLCESSEEGNPSCLGIIPQKVCKFSPHNQEKVPHVGWNNFRPIPHPNGIFDLVEENSYVYYVHSYYVEEGPCTVALTDYILPFSAAVQKDNYYATQFHPEKSGAVGEQILKNFLAL